MPESASSSTDLPGPEFKEGLDGDTKNNPASSSGDQSDVFGNLDIGDQIEPEKLKRLQEKVKQNATHK